MKIKNSLNSMSITRLLTLVSTILTAGCAHAQPHFKDLSPYPLRPHPFDSFKSSSIEISPQGYAKPLKINYIEIGEGKPLLLVHGLMTDAYSFRYVAVPLARHFKVIIPDLPGAGKSDAPEDYSMTPQSVAEVLSAFITQKQLGQVYVVGNSLGGYESLWLALLHPEQVSRLMVLHSPVFPDFRFHALKIASRLPFARLIYEKMATKNPAQFVIDNLHYFDPKLLSQEEVTHYAAIFKDPARTRVFWNILRDSMDPAHMNEMKNLLIGKKLNDKLPVRLLWARQDVLVSPDNGPKLQTLIPNAELIWFEHSSHFLQVDAPEKTVEEILKFETDLPRRPLARDR